MDRKEEAIQIVNEAIDAWGLGYAIQTGSLHPSDLEGYPELSRLVQEAYTAMRSIRKLVESN